MSRKLLQKQSYKKFLKLSSIVRKVSRHRPSGRTTWSKKMLFSAVGAKAVNNRNSNKFKSSHNDTISPIHHSGRVNYSHNDVRSKIESLLLERHRDLFSSVISQNALRRLLKQKALEIAFSLGLEKKFKGTKKWLNSFLKHCELLGYINNVNESVKHNAVKLRKSNEEDATFDSTLSSNNQPNIEDLFSPIQNTIDASSDLELHLGNDNQISSDVVDTFSSIQHTNTNGVSPEFNHPCDLRNIADLFSSISNQNSSDVPMFPTLNIPTKNVFNQNSSQNSYSRRVPVNKKDPELSETDKILISKNFALLRGLPFIPRPYFTAEYTGFKLIKTNQCMNPPVNTLPDTVYDELFDLVQEDHGPCITEHTGSNFNDNTKPSTPDSCFSDDPLLNLFGKGNTNPESHQQSTTIADDSHIIENPQCSSEDRCSPDSLFDLFNTRRDSTIRSSSTSELTRDDCDPPCSSADHCSPDSLFDLFNTRRDSTNSNCSANTSERSSSTSRVFTR